MFVLNRDGQNGARSKSERQTVQRDREQLDELLSHSHSQQGEGEKTSNRARQRGEARQEGSKVRQQRGGFGGVAVVSQDRILATAGESGAVFWQ